MSPFLSPLSLLSYPVAEKVGFAHLSPEAFELLAVVVLNRDAFQHLFLGSRL